MAEETLIEWTNRRMPDGRVIHGKTFNLWLGCTKISPACDNCYAERDMALVHKMVDWGPENEGGNRKVVVESTRGNPRKWAKKAAEEGVRPLVFTASLADVFEVWKGPMLLNGVSLPLYDLGRGMWTTDEPKAPAVPKLLTMDEARRQLFRTMARTAYGLDYLVLTKRPGHARTLWKEMLEVYRDELELAVGIEPRLKPALEYTRRTGMMPNVWFGTTAEAQKYVVQRFDELCGIPAVRRFASIEPQVEPVDIEAYLSKNPDLPGSDGLHWIIQGGESGNADAIRPFHTDWARKTRDQCEAAGVPYFFKQFGEVIPLDQAAESHLDKPHHVIWYDKAVKAGDKDGMDLMREAQQKGRVALPMVGYRVGKKNAGRTLDGRTHDAIPVSAL